MNMIELVTKYLPILDEQYQLLSKTSILDIPREFMQATGDAKKIRLAKLTLEGLADYSRSGGFVNGDVSLEWEEHTFTIDRGRSFQVDHLDNVESMGMAFGRISGEFGRLHVVPETDAYRFAKYATKAGTKAFGVLTASTVIKAINQAALIMDEAEIPEEGRILFVSNACYKLMTEDTSISKYLVLTPSPMDVNTKFMTYNDMRIVKVPQRRFMSAISLNADGGFQPTATAANLHFMMIHPSCLAQMKKYSVSRIWAPNKALAAGVDGVNPDADAWKFDFRMYHDAWVLDNKTKGIYAYIDDGTSTITIATTPADAGTAVAAATATIVVTFEEAVKTIGGAVVDNAYAAANITIRDQDGDLRPFAAVVNAGKTTATLTPTDAFDAGIYEITVKDGAFTDGDGNFVAGFTSTITLT